MAQSEGPVYALNLFDLADGDDYLAYQRAVGEAFKRHGGQEVWTGVLAEDVSPDPAVRARRFMVLVEWASREGFDAFRADPEAHDVHALRESGTCNYLWWLFDKLEFGDFIGLLKSRGTDDARGV